MNLSQRIKIWRTRLALLQPPAERGIFVARRPPEAQLSGDGHFGPQRAVRTRHRRRGAAQAGSRFRQRRGGSRKRRRYFTL
jgi:hypothetical protein